MQAERRGRYPGGQRRDAKRKVAHDAEGSHQAGAVVRLGH